MSDSFSNTANQAVVFSQALSLLVPFRDEYESAMEPNWDEAGALAIVPAVERLAARLIEDFGTVEHLIEVSPGQDGSLCFVWDDDQGNYIYLDVGPNETVHLYHDVRGGDEVGGRFHCWRSADFAATSGRVPLHWLAAS